MARVLFAIDAELEARLLPDVLGSAHEIIDRVVGARAVAEAIAEHRPDIVILQASPDTLSPISLSACDEYACRPVAVVSSDLDRRNTVALNLLETVDDRATWSEIEAVLRDGKTARRRAEPPVGSSSGVIPATPGQRSGVAQMPYTGADSIGRTEPGPSYDQGTPNPPSRRARRNSETRAQAAKWPRRQGRTNTGAEHTTTGPAKVTAARASTREAATSEQLDQVRLPSDRGQLVAVWGAHGSPGVTTTAIALAGEAAAAGHRVLLIDADSYGGAIAPMLGIVDHAPGFAAACRLAGAESLTEPELLRLAVERGGKRGAFRVLTGIPNPARWPELSRERVLEVLKLSRALADFVIVDVGFNLEADDEIASDHFGPRRNAAALAVLELADRVVSVARADVVNLQRFLRARLDLIELVGATPVDTVVTRVRSSATGVGASGQVRAALHRFGGIESPVLVPEDPSAYDRAITLGLPLGDASARSAASRALATYAAQTFGTTGRMQGSSGPSRFSLRRLFPVSHAQEGVLVKP